VLPRPRGSRRRRGLRLWLALGLSARQAAERRTKKGKAKKYYAVAVGRSTGVYTDWDEVESYVCGYSGSAHKSFKSRREAEVWYDKNTTGREVQTLVLCAASRNSSQP
jgi:hypothetical protein